MPDIRLTPLCTTALFLLSTTHAAAQRTAVTLASQGPAPAATAYIKIANGAYNGTYQLDVPATGECSVTSGAAGRFTLELLGNLTDGQAGTLRLVRSDTGTAASTSTGMFRVGGGVVAWDRKAAGGRNFKLTIVEAGESLKATFSGEPQPDSTWIGGTLTCNKVRRTPVSAGN